MLISGRAKLIEDDNGIRNKVKTIDSNEIDTLFIDNRNDNVGNGKTLVVCSEGNAGFYEVGIMGTPIALKYSVLGWNHPGFAGSSGSPHPEQDKNAIDAVVRFAIDQLGFAVEDIILYGWSIGGFSTLYAASIYPEVKGVVGSPSNWIKCLSNSFSLCTYFRSWTPRSMMCSTSPSHVCQPAWEVL